MDATEWVAVVVGVMSVVTGVAGAIRWMVKHYLHELVPNSGSSIKDKVNKLEERVDQIYLLLVEKG